MGLRGFRAGGLIGGLLGFIVGGVLPAQGNATMSFFSRIMTGNVIVFDPEGFFISSIYPILFVVILGTVGSVIGGLAEEFMRNRY